MFAGMDDVLTDDDVQFGGVSGIESSPERLGDCRGDRRESIHADGGSEDVSGLNLVGDPGEVAGVNGSHACDDVSPLVFRDDPYGVGAVGG